LHANIGFGDTGNNQCAAMFGATQTDNESAFTASLPNRLDIIYDTKFKFGNTRSD
jgi:hypothetical protein